MEIVFFHAPVKTNLDLAVLHLFNIPYMKVLFFFNGCSANKADKSCLVQRDKIGLSLNFDCI